MQSNETTGKRENFNSRTNLVRMQTLRINAKNSSGSQNSKIK